MPRIHLVPLILLACAAPTAAQRRPAAPPSSPVTPAMECTPSAVRPGEPVTCTVQRPARAAPPSKVRSGARPPSCHWHPSGPLPGYRPEFSVYAGVPTPDGRTIAVQTLQPDGPVVHLLGTADGRWTGSVPGAWSPSGPRGFAFSPNGALLAEAKEQRIVRVWSTRTGQVRFSLLHPRTQGPDVSPDDESVFTDVISVSFSPDGRLLSSTSMDGSVAVWSVGGGRLLWTRVLGGSALSSMAVFGPDGLLYASAAGGVQVLSPRDGGVLRTLWIPAGTVPHTRDSVRVMVQSTSLDIAVSGNGQVLAASGVSAEQGSGEVASKTAWLAVRSVFKPEPPRLIWPPSAVTGVRVSHDGRWIVGTALATAYVWDAETGSEVFRIPTSALEKEFAGVLTDAFVSPDGALLYTIHSGARPVVAWSLANEVPAGAQCHLPFGSKR